MSYQKKHIAFTKEQCKIILQEKDIDIITDEAISGNAEKFDISCQQNY